MRKALSLLLVSSMFVVGAACGGKEPVPPKPPESEPVGASEAGADMPAPPATSLATGGGDAGAAEASTAPTPPPTPVGVTLPSDTVKIALKGKKTANLELKSDGTVMSGGKPAAKITSSEVQDKDGKAVLSVSGDAVNTPSGTSVANFQGDDLVGAKGDKLSMKDDGTLTWTSGGKDSPAGKAEGASSAKRATLLAAWFVLSPPPAPEKAAPAKPAGKETPAKPAGKETPAKPAPKK
jgi:hypothetical protein